MSSLTSRLRLLLQTAGTNTGTWGDVANQIFSNIDDGIAGVAAYTVTGGTLVMSASTINATDEARCAFITAAGALTSAQTIVAPQSAKTYVFLNTTTGAFTLSLSTLAGTPIVIPQNTVCLVGVSPVNGYPQFFGPPINLTTGKIDISGLSNIPLSSMDVATQALVNNATTAAQLNVAVAAEATARVAADSAEFTARAAETAARIAGDAAEATARTTADAAEAAARIAGDATEATARTTATALAVLKAGDAMSGPLVILTPGAPLVATSADGAGNGVSGQVSGSGNGNGTYGVVVGSGSGSGALGTISGNGGGNGVAGQVNGNGGGNGIYGVINGTGPGSGALGVINGAGAGDGTHGVINGTGPGSGALGVINGTGSGNGVAGLVNGTGSGNGVAGLVNGSGPGAGTLGIVNGNGGGDGVNGIVRGTGSGNGVSGLVNGNGNGDGTHGAVNGNGNGNGVYGGIFGAGAGNAGYFFGNVVASGTITPSDKRLKSDILPLAPIASKFGALPLFSYVKHRNGVEVDYHFSAVMNKKRVELQTLNASMATLKDADLKDAQDHSVILAAEIKKWDDEDWLPVMDKAYPGRDYGPMAQDVQAIAPELVEANAHGILQIKPMAVAFALIDDLRTQLGTLRVEFAAYRSTHP